MCQSFGHFLIPANDEGEKGRPEFFAQPITHVDIQGGRGVELVEQEAGWGRAAELAAARWRWPTNTSVAQWCRLFAASISAAPGLHPRADRQWRSTAIDRSLQILRGQLLQNHVNRSATAQNQGIQSARKTAHAKYKGSVLSVLSSASRTRLPRMERAREAVARMVLSPAPPTT